MTGQNNTNKRPTLRDTETRAELDGAGVSGKRPALASSHGGSATKESSSKQAGGRPSTSKQIPRSKEQEPSALPAPDSSSKVDAISEADFSNIKDFIDSLGDTQSGLDIDDDSSAVFPPSDAQQSQESPATTDGSQEKQNAPSALTTVTPAIATSGTERDRSGLESDLASIRLEDTDYRRIGHRNNDDKPLATLIKGGIAI